MIKICKNCQKKFETHTRTKWCSTQCYSEWKDKKFFPDGSDYVVCKICNHRAADLNKHIVSKHKCTAEEYCKKFNINAEELQSKTMREHNSLMQKKAYAEGRLKGWGKGNDNPSKRQNVRNGRQSIFSMNYRGYDGLSDDEKRQKISTLLRNLAQKKKENANNPLTIDYYLKRGLSYDEAKQKLKERQCTFSHETCIAKYGEVEGEIIFNERQKKWKQTLNSKPIEEIERINKSKLSDGKGWSKISQILFNDIVKELNGEYSTIYYATNNNLKDNNEYMVVDKDSDHVFFLDFYIKDNNKVIEFDGDYWHGEKRGNQKRDKEREEKLKKLGFVNIYHVKERDYKADPNKVLQECLAFIRK